MKQAGQIRENFAKNAGVVAVIGFTLLFSINALYMHIKAYGVLEVFKNHKVLIKMTNVKFRIRINNMNFFKIKCLHQRSIARYIKIDLIMVICMLL